MDPLADQVDTKATCSIVKVLCLRAEANRKLTETKTGMSPPEQCLRPQLDAVEAKWQQRKTA